MMAKTIMSTNFLVLLETTTFLEAAKLFLKLGVTAAPVITDTGNVVGILSEKNLLRAMYPTYEEFYKHLSFFSNTLDNINFDANEKIVKDIMSTKIIPVNPNTNIFKIGGLMLASGTHQVPVLDNGIIVGMISRRDIYRAILQEKYKVLELSKEAQG